MSTRSTLILPARHGKAIIAGADDDAKHRQTTITAQTKKMKHPYYYGQLIAIKQLD